MIRTRDAVLFVLCLIVLLLAIMVTVLHDRTSEVSLNLDLSAIPEASEAGAEIVTETTREKLALDTSAVVADPDTFVEDVPPEETDVPMEEDAQQIAKRCLYPDDVLPKVASWPVGKVKVAVIGNERVAYTEETILVATASTTETDAAEVPEVVRTELVALPVNPISLPTASCIPSDVIGMTPNGTLLFNNDARIWQNVGPETLIGYARDGYPIYGRYDGAVDACGGYQSGNGYRYSIAADRPYIVGCFTATPQSFSL
jgi:hypothetical protein